MQAATCRVRHWRRHSCMLNDKAKTQPPGSSKFICNWAQRRWEWRIHGHSDLCSPSKQRRKNKNVICNRHSARFEAILRISGTHSLCQSNCSKRFASFWLGSHRQRSRTEALLAVRRSISTGPRRGWPIPAICMSTSHWHPLPFQCCFLGRPLTWIKYACYAVRPTMTQFLVENGADVNCVAKPWNRSGLVYNLPAMCCHRHLSWDICDFRSYQLTLILLHRVVTILSFPNILIDSIKELRGRENTVYKIVLDAGADPTFELPGQISIILEVLLSRQHLVSNLQFSRRMQQCTYLMLQRYAEHAE